MIDVARSASGADVDWVVGSGRELPFNDEAFDVVLAIDSFPYVHQGGDALVREVAREVRRVLSPGGRFAILNVAYGDDPVRDAGIAERLAKENDFVIAVRVACPSTIWTVPAWVLGTRPSASGPW
jgi:ubiquinone/menaquinone biosynthesis C-methylase UbiE